MSPEFRGSPLFICLSIINKNIMISAIALTLSTFLFGALIINWLDPLGKFSILEKTAGTILIGQIASSYIFLIGSLITKSQSLAITIYEILFFIIIALRWNSIFNFFRKLKKIKIQKKYFKNIGIIIALILIIGLYTWYLLRMFHVGPNGELRSMMPGWGDNALHVNFIKRFSATSPFNLAHPLLANSRLVYPFLIDFSSSILHFLGANIVLAYQIPIILGGVSAFILCFSLAKGISKSQRFAVIALLLILLGSGLGFTSLWRDIKDEYSQNQFSNINEFISNPPHEYTHLDNRTGGKITSSHNTNDNIVWIVPVVSFLAHQRSFIWGFGMFLLIMLGVVTYGKEKQWWRYGFVAGAMPFVHGHTFLSLFIVLLTLFFWHLKQWKAWIYLGLITTAIAVPMLIFFFTNPANALGDSFLKPWFGWMTCVHRTSWIKCSPEPGTNSNALWFWINNFGVMFLIWSTLLVAYSTKWLTKINFGIQNSKWVAASAMLFLVPNLFLLQPWDFDNGKMFFYWWTLAIIFLVVPFLKKMWEKNVLFKIIVGLIIFFGLIAGSVDVLSKLTGDANAKSSGYIDGSRDALEVASWIEKNTNPNDLFLTDTSIDPIPLFLSGRKVFMGYDGWLWSHGLEYGNARENAKKIIQGDLSVACSENVDFILIDSGLEKAFGTITEESINKLGKIVYENSDRKILRIKCYTTAQ
ncbi:MAG: hypothetical protein COU07_03660 [Candidatus Harrisonbacteria bacterium CG10_big_fil_rev_8_21_14_0_10_40_38]|uniref:Glycosyltransferase RgtA/B/C/D-like domain-containing protein n=1 Tax=Candidatus Harrisonbacteria bacterium CG10_big_fil_rev_8_21_14_0_10_40_38 TaxID=1974583 RepID=A0A2H0URA3_9BACT|nr:MAG: hypothetical protein COU07_03660 [Candidatus Harrisonbacteria bacterium CG10_big_fil_rev_8_21_14_0_10_40_38]